MQKLLRGRLAGEVGFTLMDLLIVVMIVGILAAAAVPLYLGYVRDSRLAEAKGLAGSVLTAAQACAQQNTPNEAANCAMAQLAQKIGVDSAGNTPDGRWVVAVPTIVTVSATTNKWTNGQITIAGVAGQTSASMAAGVFVNTGTGAITLRCRTTDTAVVAGGPLCWGRPGEGGLWARLPPHRKRGGLG